MNTLLWFDDSQSLRLVAADDRPILRLTGAGWALFIATLEKRGQEPK
jgi:hypothetical protein